MSADESATPLGKVRGLGTSGEGGHHCLEERFSSVALVLLSLAEEAANIGAAVGGALAGALLGLTLPLFTRKSPY